LNTWIICQNTFKESVRDRIFYVLLVFALFFIMASKAIAWIGLDDIGTGLIYKETDKRTIYTVLSKPVRRYQFILGKYFGLLLMLLVNVAVMGACFIGYLYLLQRYTSLGLVKALLMIYLELVLLTAVAIMFSTMASPILSAVFTFSTYMTGHFMDGFRMLSERADKAGSTVGKFVCDFVYYILPNLGFFDAKREAVHAKPITLERIGLCLGYCIIYTAILLTISLLVFRRKNF